MVSTIAESTKKMANIYAIGVWAIAVIERYKMTREEALQILDTILTIGEQVDALELAIEALEQEPCEDCISRTQAIKAMDELENEDIEAYGCSIPEGFDGERARQAICLLPSIQPKPKWIPVSERLPENSGNYLITYCYQNEIETQEAVYVKDEEDKWFDITDIEITLAVIAWMPLPEPYKAESEE